MRTGAGMLSAILPKITVLRVLMLAILAASLAWLLLDPHEPFALGDQSPEPYAPIILPDQTP